MTREVLVSDSKTADIDIITDVFEGTDVTVRSTTAHDTDTLVEEAVGVEGLIIDSNTPVEERAFRELDSLRVVGRAGIGVDNVDVEAADEHGVVVVNVPDYCLDEVSTHAFGLVLACLRRLGTYDRSVKRGEWEWTVGKPIPRLAGSTVGIFAFGKIGRSFAAKLRGFDVDVVVCDPYVPDDRFIGFDVERVGFEELLSRSDIVSIHGPLTDETRGIFDRTAFEQMGEDVILVNTARGPIVDEDALREALEDGTVDTAGLDVREEEPPGDSPLHDREDVLLSPHVAWYSEGSRIDLRTGVAEDVARFFRGEDPKNPVVPGSAWT